MKIKINERVEGTNQKVTVACLISGVFANYMYEVSTKYEVSTRELNCLTTYSIYNILHDYISY